MAKLMGNHPSQQTILLACAVALLLQLTLAPQIVLFGGRVNFLLAASCALAPCLPPNRAVLLGFAAGLLYDLTASVPIGLMVLLSTLGVFALFLACGGHPLGATGAGVRLTCLAIAIIQALYALILFFMGFETSLVSALFAHALPSIILTSIAALPFLRFAGANSQTARIMRPSHSYHLREPK